MLTAKGIMVVAHFMLLKKNQTSLRYLFLRNIFSINNKSCTVEFFIDIIRILLVQFDFHRLFTRSRNNSSGNFIWQLHTSSIFISLFGSVWRSSNFNSAATLQICVTRYRPRLYFVSLVRNSDKWLFDET